MTNVKTLLNSSALALAFGVMATASVASTITTPGGSEVGNFRGSEVYGQSFVAGADNVLNSVNLTAYSASGSDEGVIYELFSFDDAANTVNGAALFSTTGTIVSSASLLPVSVLTGGWALTSGQTYIFSMRHDDGVGNGRWGYNRDADNYTSGAFHYSNESSYLNNDWNTNFGGSGLDMQIELNFGDGDMPSAVPLPAGLPLLLAGLAGFGIVSRRKR